MPKEVFVWAYERSCALYLATRQELGEPDPFRLRYRNHIISMVGIIVRGCMTKSIAVDAIRQKANKVVPPKDQAGFIEVVENELMSLHMENIALAWKPMSDQQTCRKPCLSLGRATYCKPTFEHEPKVGFRHLGLSLGGL